MYGSKFLRTVYFVGGISFDVPELQVHAGKEKEAVLDMLPYLRLGYVSEPSEMQSVISSQGPICLVILHTLDIYVAQCYFKLHFSSAVVLIFFIMLR